MWRKSSKPVACRFLDIEVEAQIGERGFRVCNSSIQLVSVNYSQGENLKSNFNVVFLFDTEWSPLLFRLISE